MDQAARGFASAPTATDLGVSLSPPSKRAPGARHVLAVLLLAAVAAPLPLARAEPKPTLHGVSRHPYDLDVLVNKHVRLPARFRPRDLVVPDVRFIFSGFHEKRQLRRVAARALERMFRAARRDGAPLAGVSGYRSEATQRSLFGFYVSQLGLSAASRISARPRHSEHETGLAIDVAGADGMCPAAPCFARTRAARWIAEHAPDHGFVVRYPAEGEGSTGYQYEPWHLRYLGRDLANAVAGSGLTYEEFLTRPCPPQGCAALVTWRTSGRGQIDRATSRPGGPADVANKVARKLVPSFPATN